MASRAKIKPLLGSALDILLPLSHNYARDNDLLDWGEFNFLDEPCCHFCGYPFEFDLGPGATCAPCSARKPAYDQCRAGFAYDDKSRQYILSFKHGGRTSHLARFTRQLQRAGRGFWPETDMIVPVPLHHSRLVKRKFNQAALLAKSLSGHVDIPFEPEILFRHKATTSQGEQTQKGRFRNVQGAFTVSESARTYVKGKTVLIIDDVMTTGATLESCARTLKRAGAAKVNALVLARVVRAQQIPT